MELASTTKDAPESKDTDALLSKQTKYPRIFVCMTLLFCVGGASGVAIGWELLFLCQKFPVAVRFRNGVFARDHEFVAVFHVAPSMLHPMSEEGRGSGWAWNGVKGNATIDYGCWFVPVEETPRSVYVNVRRSLRTRTRREVADVLGSDCVTPSCEDNDADRRWCERARALGYDSIQTLHGNNGNAEIVLCYGGCMTERLAASGCVPVELHDATGRNCSCPKSTEVLACGDDSVPYDDTYCL